MKIGEVNTILDLTNELTELLEKDESEICRFEETFEILRAIKEVREKQQALLKKSIQKLCSLVEEDKERLSVNPEREKYLAREASIKEQVTKATESRAQAQQECKVVHDKLAQLDEVQAEIAQERETVENNTTKVLPTIRYDLNLYYLICRIRWQYDSGLDDVSGYVCNKGDVKPFSLNMKQSSQFFITNYLWDLIEEGSQVW